MTRSIQTEGPIGVAAPIDPRSDTHLEKGADHDLRRKAEPDNPAPSAIRAACLALVARLRGEAP